MRYAAMKCMSRSYRPTLPVAYIAQVLGFSSVLPTAEPNDEKDVDAIEECVEWLKAHGACLITDNPDEVLLDAKVCCNLDVILKCPKSNLKCPLVNPYVVELLHVLNSVFSLHRQHTDFTSNLSILY